MCSCCVSTFPLIFTPDPESYRLTGLRHSILSLVSPNTASCHICFSCICSLPPRWHSSSTPMWTIAMLWIPAQFHFHWAANTCAAARVIFQKHIQIMLCSYLQHCPSFALLKEIHSSSTAWPLVSMYLWPFLVLLSCVRRARQIRLILLWAYLTFFMLSCTVSAHLFALFLLLNLSSN